MLTCARVMPCAEQYLREVWPAVTRALKEHGIACELNLVRSLGPAPEIMPQQFAALQIR